MENLDKLVKEARELLQEMGEVLSSLNTGINAESDAKTQALETGAPVDDSEIIE